MRVRYHILHGLGVIIFGLAAVQFAAWKDSTATIYMIICTVVTAFSYWSCLMFLLTRQRRRITTLQANPLAIEPEDLTAIVSTHQGLMVQSVQEGFMTARKIAGSEPVIVVQDRTEKHVIVVYDPAPAIPPVSRR